MSDRRIKYLLKCPACQAEHQIDQGQAGMTIPCLCGNKLDVPTIRHLSKLRRIEVATESDALPDEGWSLQRGLVLLGLVIAAIGGITAVVLMLRPVPVPTAETFAQQHKNDIPAITFSEWWELKNIGPQLDRGRSRLVVEMDKLARDTRERLDGHRRWTWGAWGVTAVGLVFAGLSQLVFRSPARTNGRPARQREGAGASH